MFSDLTFKMGLYSQLNLMDPGKEAYGIALQAYENGEPYACITVNLRSRIGDFCEFIGFKNAAYVDKNNCPEAAKLIEMGVAKDAGFTKQSGFCEYPLYVFDEEWLRSISSDGSYEKYETCYNDIMSWDDDE